ncbi:hypothetical protein GCM10012320_35590 [Sinomonas cellulolyticus]|nr:hypothetical protein GCM10012320_35590 [Sinomonas sp. KCTC 49339]
MPVRVPGPARAVDDGDGVQFLDRDDLLRAARPDPCHRMPGEPAADLGRRVLLSGIERCRHLGVQGRCDGEGLRGVDHHLREARRPQTALPRPARDPQPFPGDRVRPVDPCRVRLRGQVTDRRDLAVAVELDELGNRRVAEVVVIGARAIGFDVPARIRAVPAEKCHTALHTRLPHLCERQVRSAYRR